MSIPTREKARWITAGYQDNIDRAPGANCPEPPNRIPYLNPAETEAHERRQYARINAYWEGFYAATEDAFAKAQKQRNR